MGKYKILRFLLLFVWSVSFFSCQKIESLVEGKSKREKYLRTLEKADLMDQEPVRQWQQKFEEALADPIPIKIPYSEQIIYPVGDTRADAFLIEVPAGRKIVVEIVRREGRGEIFLEARSLIDKEEIIASLDSSFVQINADNELKRLVVVCQPELMAYGKWDLLISHHPSLSFPVEGKDDSSVGSFFGDPRDGGRRKHHGIDLFAAKGTPALAVDDGWVYRTGQNNLGGNVVWLNADAGSIYYAHLDSIAVSAPSKVKVGDTLGFVGNTGNAKYTPPHLHFGIYNNGPIDPFPYVRGAASPGEVENYGFATAKLSIRSRANFRSAPNLRSSVIAQLEKESELFVLGKSGDWLRVWIDTSLGYVHSSLVEAAEAGEMNIQFHP